MKLAVIIPVWNDAGPLRSALAEALADRREVETIVVDGGSDDESADVGMQAGVRVLRAPVRNRAAQLNLGVQVSSGDVLLFLHADTQLPSGWHEAIVRVMTEDLRAVGGAFRRRFVPGSWFLRATCVLADWRGRAWGWFLGDQAMFVRRSAFDGVGGFACLRACEDLDLSRRLARVGRLVLLRDTVITSDRRFRRRGAVRQTLEDVATTCRFLRAPDSFLETATPSLQQ
jgi:rSAM/selenodomain-associated transferase 2